MYDSSVEVLIYRNYFIGLDHNCLGQLLLDSAVASSNTDNLNPALLSLELTIPRLAVLGERMGLGFSKLREIKYRKKDSHIAMLCNRLGSTCGKLVVTCVTRIEGSDSKDQSLLVDRLA